MNYLAHLHLGGPAPQQLLGSLYGDFVKGSLEGRFPPALEAAIRLHRHIDSYTDRHPLVLAAWRAFRVSGGALPASSWMYSSTIAWRGIGATTPSSPLSSLLARFIGCCWRSQSCRGGWRGLHRSWQRMTG